MRVLFIGAVNSHKPPRGGEEYKNQLLLKHLAPFFQLQIIDTVYWKANPKVLFSLCWSLLFGRHDRIVLSASSLSVYRLLQAMHLLPARLVRTIYLVIGGYFPEAVLNGRYKADRYGKLNCIAVEGQTLADQLAEAGLRHNVRVIPNFKDFPKNLTVSVPMLAPFRFVFISQVRPEKGVDVLLQAVQSLRAVGYAGRFHLDFYGPIVHEYKDAFMLHLDEQLQYKGFLDLANKPDEAYATLAGYHCMVFPTHWQGEGFPGVLLDAMVAGLPVIASEWNMNAELIVQEKDGLIVPPHDVEALAAAMQRMIDEPDFRNACAIHIQQKADAYHSSTVIPSIIKLIEAQV